MQGSTGRIGKHLCNAWKCGAISGRNLTTESGQTLGGEFQGRVSGTLRTQGKTQRMEFPSGGRTFGDRLLNKLLLLKVDFLVQRKVRGGGGVWHKASARGGGGGGATSSFASGLGSAAGAQICAPHDLPRAQAPAYPQLPVRGHRQRGDHRQRHHATITVTRHSPPAPQSSVAGGGILSNPLDGALGDAGGSRTNRQTTGKRLFPCPKGKLLVP